MKKNVLFVVAHSLIDTITNSSSEIFVCGTDKSVEFIKRYLRDLLEKLKSDLEYAGRNLDFEAVFGKIYVVTEKNVGELADCLVLDYGLPVAELQKDVPDLASLPEIPRPPDYFEITQGYKYKYPYENHEEHNKQVEEQRSSSWQEARDNYWSSYGDSIKKVFLGKICIESVDDNSIPYAIFEDICEELNAFHVHLG